MPPFLTYIANRQPIPRPNLGAVNHPDVSLLAHMAILVCAETYKRSGQLLSRDKCFGIAFGHVTLHLWPPPGVVPPALAKSSVFLGEGPFERGSLRKWVGDVHGLVLAQRLLAGELGRRRKHADSRAKKIRDDAEAHLQFLIDTVARRAISNSALLLTAALQQLQKELF